MNWRTIGLAGILLSLAVLALLNRGTPAGVAIGLQPGSVNYPMMHALDGQFFERQGLTPELKLFRSANDALDALLGATILVDAVVPIQNIAAIENQKPGSLGAIAFLISDREHPLDYLLAKAESGIEKPLDLQGKTLVVFPGTFSEALTRLTLAKLGVTDVRFIKRTPEDMMTALKNGDAIAGVFYGPAAQAAIRNDEVILLEQGFWEAHLLPEIVVGAYAFNLPQARKEPDLFLKSFSAIEAAILDSRRNSAKAKQAIGKYLPAFADVAGDVPDARVVLVNEIDPVLIDRTLELYKSHSIIENSIDPRPMISRSINVSRTRERVQ